MVHQTMHRVLIRGLGHQCGLLAHLLEKQLPQVRTISRILTQYFSFQNSQCHMHVLYCTCVSMSCVSLETHHHVGL